MSITQFWAAAIFLNTSPGQSMLVGERLGGSPTGQQSANTANWIVWPLRPPRTTALCLPMPGGQTGFQTQLFKRQLSLYLLLLILHLWCILWRGILNGHINARADTNHCHLIFATHFTAVRLHLYMVLNQLNRS